MIRFNIKKLMKAKNITDPPKQMKKLGISKKVAERLLNDEAQSIKKSHINALCEFLHCQPNDLFVWAPDNKNKNRDYSGHPLLDIRDGNLPEVGPAIRLLRVEKIREIGKDVEDELKKNAGKKLE